MGVRSSIAPGAVFLLVALIALLHVVVAVPVRSPQASSTTASAGIPIVIPTITIAPGVQVCVCVCMCVHLYMCVLNGVYVSSYQRLYPLASCCCLCISLE